MNSGTVTPPHFNGQEKLRNTTSGVFGWYASVVTLNGIENVYYVIYQLTTGAVEDAFTGCYYNVYVPLDESVVKLIPSTNQ